jgi:formate transporter
MSFSVRPKTLRAYIVKHSDPTSSAKEPWRSKVQWVSLSTMTTTEEPLTSHEHTHGPGLDAPLPKDMAVRAANVGLTKANLPLPTTTLLGVLAGAFIGLGAMLSSVVTSDSGIPFGVLRLLGGLVFSLGLVLVVVGGAELFTGNNLIVMAFASRQISLRRLIRNWAVVFLANFAGAIATALLVNWSGQYRNGKGLIGRRVLEIAQTKTTLPFREAIFLGVLANALVCMAVWLSFAARSVTDKVIAVIGPVSAFVAAGFEHSIANMYFIPAGIFVRRWAPPKFWSDTTLRPNDYPSVNWRRCLLSNLLPVTIGNIIGGAFLVGIVYWFVYLHTTRREEVRV